MPFVVPLVPQLDQGTICNTNMSKVQRDKEWITGVVLALRMSCSFHWGLASPANHRLVANCTRISIFLFSSCPTSNWVGTKSGQCLGVWINVAEKVWWHMLVIQVIGSLTIGRTYSCRTCSTMAFALWPRRHFTELRLPHEAWKRIPFNGWGNLFLFLRWSYSHISLSSLLRRLVAELKTPAGPIILLSWWFFTQIHLWPRTPVTLGSYFC